MKKGRLAVAVLIAVLILAAYVGPAMAYFSAYTTAEGKYTLSIKPKTEIEEEFYNWTKHVTIKNTGDMPCYIRAAVFCGGDIEYTANGKGWYNGGDGYWYYDTILEPGETSEVLLVKISHIPESVKDGDEFNVAVVYEYSPVFYTDKGEPYADWTKKENIYESSGGQN